MNLPACMGGWCVKRGHCPHYHAADKSEPAERLCAPGRDGEMLDPTEREELVEASEALIRIFGMAA